MIATLKCFMKSHVGGKVDHNHDHVGDSEDDGDGDGVHLGLLDEVILEHLVRQRAGRDCFGKF